MRRPIVIPAALVALLLLAMLGPVAFAQGMKWRGSGGWGPGSPYGRMYDAKTVDKVTGEVAKVDTITPMRGMSGGVHVALKSEQGEVSVHLGPQWYLENQDVKIEPGDRVEITGSRARLRESRPSSPPRSGRATRCSSSGTRPVSPCGPAGGSAGAEPARRSPVTRARRWARAPG